MANTKVTGDLIASSTIATGNIADNAVTSDKISGITTAHITEGSNLYYTDARADARITAATTSDLTEGTNLYYTDARADARAALLVDSAPSTLDTLNELAAALGDDPNFATTTANSIGLKAPLASPTFTGTVGISATIPRLNFTDLQQDDWAIINDNGEFKFQCTSGSGVALLLNTSNHATFAGKITAPILSIQNQINTTSSNLEMNYANGDGTTTSFKDFYIRDGKNAVILNIQGSSKNATFSGGVTGAIARFDTLNNNANSANIIYRSGTDTIVGGGSLPNKIYIQDSGKVGINDNDPINALEVKGTFAAPLTTGSAQNGIVRFSQTAGVGSLDIGFGDPYSWLQSRSSSSYATNYNLALQPNGGRVGIGTTSPGSTLTLGNATGNVAELRVLRSNSLSTTYGFINTVGGTAQLGGSSDTRIIASTGRLLFNSNTRDQISLEANGEYRLKLGSNTAGYEASMDNSDTAYRIFGSRFGGTGKYVAIWSDGANENTRFYPTKTVFYKNVGIGTTSPNNILHISDAGATTLVRVGNNGAYDAGIYFNTSTDWTIGTDTSNSNAFTIGNSSSVGASPKIVIQTGGNVGIGTTGPSAKLDARGAIMTGSAVEDGNFSSTTATGMSNAESGSLQITQGWVGSGTNGDTVVFRYNATSWKSWGLEWNFMSTNGMSSGFIGGYNNNSTGHSKVINNNAHGITVSFSNSSQHNIITFTSTSGFGTHPMASFKYYQSGGDGRPYPSKASITMNS